MLNFPYDIHPDLKRAAIPMPGINRYTIPLLNGVLRVLRWLNPPKANMTLYRTAIRGVDGNPIPVIVFKPRHADKNLPALVYYHGGAFVLTYSDMHLRNAALYAEQANCCVVFVDYRLAPRHLFPAGFNDCYSALEWTFDSADTLGVDRNRIAVSGDSAGGALAAGVAQKCVAEGKNALRGQMLMYPVTDKDCKTDSVKKYPDTPIWNGRTTKQMWALYLPQAESGHIPAYASPSHGNLTGLPATYIEVAEFDPLRDEGINYAQALAAAGTELVMHDTRGTFHAYDIVFGSAITQDSLKRRIHFLKQIFSQA